MTRQQRALAAICDTFAPGGDGRGSASELGVPLVIEQLLAQNPRAGERMQVAALLAAWDSRVLTALGGAGLRRFGQLPQEDRERVLRSWCDSKLGRRRAAFHGLRRAALVLSYVMTPDGTNPAWEGMGYPGPLGPPASPPAPGITPLPVAGDTRLDCDVCVVGSGAGGGAAAGVLAAAGLDVVVVEAGGYYDDHDFDGSELDGLGRLYYRQAAATTADQGVLLFAGACLGGGTVVNFSTSFRTPDQVREEWAGHGLPDLVSPEFSQSLDAVGDRLGVNTAQSRPSRRERLFQRGLEALGWHVGTMPRNVRGCDQGTVCGYCGFGCQLGAKQSTVKTWLADAHAAGARIVVGTKAERVRVEGGSARGVEARTLDGHEVRVRSRAVVVAAGAIETTALLRRSGLRNDAIGRHLRLHPATGIAGIFDEEVRPWEGTMQALYSDQHRDLDRGYGLKYESVALHPGIAALFAPWRSARQHRDLMDRLRNIDVIVLLVRDRDAGEVKVDRAGNPVVKYRMSPYDTVHMRAGVEGGARILEAAGAATVFTTHARWVAYEPSRGERVEALLERADAAGWGPGQYNFSSFHIMGTARMGGDDGTYACNPDGETWEVRDLVVCDGSVFPTAPGVNPMISIEALSHLNARKLAARLS